MQEFAKFIGNLVLALFTYVYFTLSYALVATYFYWWFVMDVVSFDVPIITYGEMVGVLLFMKILVGNTTKTDYSYNRDEALYDDNETRFDEGGKMQKIFKEVKWSQRITLFITPWVALGLGKFFYEFVFPYFV